ncbi:CYFA0S03e01376g1_1 [Cyberlindnera fabianii]|uniref:CYFA0S03e01376g1_1 n=1 Tax=Cyberlindnera fabianii TaxID=36022 RepID=A0A061AV32_CYBFA|nr:Ethionine resistance-conferring protein 1 [Cyberlindnera fabianii]CDR39253.1 CYFA0S03e01376g1_1 [Cyberlindnera fabianii]
MAAVISEALKQLHGHPALRTNGFGIANSHRKFSLTFVPPSTKSPLFIYNKSPGARSFLSLGTDYESLRESDEDGDDDDTEMGGELSRTVSLPSQISERHEPDQLDWLLEEHQRRYSSVNNSESDEDDGIEDEGALDPDNVQAWRGYQIDDDEYSNFMARVRHTRHTNRRTSITSVSSVSVQQVSEEDFAHEKVTKKSEVKKLLQYAIPLVTTFFLEQIFSVVCVLVVAHLGKNELAAVSLATMTANIVFAIFEGISTALDTLCPQAYGAGDFHGVGIHLQRCTLLSLTIFIPFGFAWWFSDIILSLVVPEKEVVHLASQFLRIMLPGAPAYIIFENLKRYLQAQGIFEAGTYVLLLCAPLNVLLSYLLVWDKRIGLGFIGAPIAVTFNFWLMLILLVGYTVFIDGEKCWGGFSSKSLEHWKALLDLAIPGVIMLEAESLSYEIMTLLSSFFGTDYMAAQSAVSTLASLTYMIPFSVGIASSTRIANFVGARRIDCAALAAHIGIEAAVIVGVFNCVVFLIFRRPLANLFSKDEQVIEMIVELFPLIAAAQIFDSLNAVAGSCMRGQGMQRIGSYINLFVYYVLGIPLAWVLGYYLDYKLVGLWLGITISLLLIGVSESWCVLRVDWNKVLSEADMRKMGEMEAGELSD